MSINTKKQVFLFIFPYVFVNKKVKIIDVSKEPKYECECTKQRFADGLMTLGNEQLTELIEEDGKAEIQCQFCNKRYNFNKEELEEILIRTKK